MLLYQKNTHSLVLKEMEFSSYLCSPLFFIQIYEFESKVCEPLESFQVMYYFLVGHQLA